MSEMKLVRVEEWLLPQYREQARKNVKFHEDEMRSVCDGMRDYVRSKEDPETGIKYYTPVIIHNSFDGRERDE